VVLLIPPAEHYLIRYRHSENREKHRGPPASTC